MTHLFRHNNRFSTYINELKIEYLTKQLLINFITYILKFYNNLLSKK